MMHSRTFRRLAAAALITCVGIAAATAPRKRKPRKTSKARAVPVTVAGIENAQVLEPWFAALRGLESRGEDRIVRVMHFGDSHTAADFLTGRIRQRLQGRFGNGGPGLILAAKPWRGYPHEGVAIVDGRTWPATSLRDSATDGWLGAAGAAVFPPAGGTFRVQASFSAYRIHTLAPDRSLPKAQWTEVQDELSLPGIPESRPSSEEPHAYQSEQALDGTMHLEVSGEAGLPPVPRRELAIQFPAGSRFLGVDLRSGHSGLIYDELGLNGAELLELERWRPEVRRALFRELRPDLLVLAYGTNDMGRLGSDATGFIVRLRALLETLKKESGAAILVVGPPDRMGDNRRQTLALRESATAIITALKEASQASGCAFWDARAAMGGPGSMLAWRKAGLAREDLVHFTVPGYERLGTRFSESLMMAFERLGKTAGAE